MRIDVIPAPGRHSRESGNPENLDARLRGHDGFLVVIPAKAGIQKTWMPASTGMTE